jgi:hypothetical protein
LLSQDAVNGAFNRPAVRRIGDIARSCAFDETGMFAQDFLLSRVAGKPDEAFKDFCHWQKHIGLGSSRLADLIECCVQHATEIRKMGAYAFLTLIILPKSKWIMKAHRLWQRPAQTIDHRNGGKRVVDPRLQGA